MRTEWQECKRGSGVRSRWLAAYVSLNPKGSLVMNRQTYERLGEPEAVHLLFDGANNRIGIKATSPGVRNAFPVVRQGKKSGRQISAYPLMQEFAIRIKQTIVFPDAEIDREGILNLDLREAQVSPRSRGQQARRGEERSRREAPKHPSEESMSGVISIGGE